MESIFVALGFVWVMVISNLTIQQKYNNRRATPAAPLPVCERAEFLLLFHSQFSITPQLTQQHGFLVALFVIQAVAFNINYVREFISFAYKEFHC